jgi:chemotaxis protein methyltransferase CheR
MSEDALNIDRTALDQLAALLLQRAGLKITPDGYHGLRLALLARMPALGLSDALDYVRRLKHLAGDHELRALLPLVTVGKTEFFRDSRQFHAFQQEIVPKALIQARRENRPLRIWSAGCATGEEPWSLAMVAAECGALEGEVDLRATDVNPVAVEAAARGRYAARRLVGVSEERLAKFFVEKEGDFHIGPLLRPFVKFEGHNLAAPVWPQVQAQSLDVIFCRNVIIYFDQPTIVGVLERFWESLRPGGWLFLGYSESLYKLHTRFSMVDVAGTFLYRRPRPDEQVRPPPYLGDKPKPSAPMPSSPGRSQSGIFAPPPGGIPSGSQSGYPSPFRTSVSGSNLAPVPSASSPNLMPVPSASSPNLPAVGGTPTGTSAVGFAPVVSSPSGLRRSPTSVSSSNLPPIPSAPRPGGSGLRTPIERLDEVVQAIEKGDFPKALRVVHALVTDEPLDLAARLTLGNVHALMGNIDEAKECYAAVLAMEPLCVEARLYLAMAALQGSRTEEAKTELTRALFLEPNLAIGHYLLGQVNERRGDAEGARRSYRNAIGLRKGTPHDLVGHFPDLPRSNEAVAQSAQYRLAALSER